MSGNPPEETLADALCVSWGLVVQLWCVRDGVADERVVAAANEREPLGSVGTGSWHIDDSGDVSEHVKRCPDYRNRRHLVVNC